MATYDNLPPFAEDMYAIYEDKEDLFNEDDQDEIEELASQIDRLMMTVDNKMWRMDEILKERLGPKYMGI